ncbi:alpha/beta hydrolase fold family protein [Mycobacterium xenopi 3993]|nr:alpha/beta hydrolase fold family protein [Mycobacterium xenopi 3993]
MILYFHGGGFVIGGPQTHRRLVSRLSAACGGTPVCSVEYRQLPDVPIADSVGDCVRAYQCLLRRYASSEIVLAGDSAGGHLALAVAVASRKLELPQPAGIFAISPWIDLAADAVHRCPNVGSDPYITPNMLSWIGHLHESRFGPLRTELCDSDCDLSGVAPTLIQVGGWRSSCRMRRRSPRGLSPMVCRASCRSTPVRCTFFICSLTCYPKRGLRSTSSLSLWRRPPDHTPRRSAVRESGWHRGL